MVLFVYSTGGRGESDMIDVCLQKIAPSVVAEFPLGLEGPESLLLAEGDEGIDDREGVEQVFDIGGNPAFYQSSVYITHLVDILPREGDETYKIVTQEFVEELRKLVNRARNLDEPTVINEVGAKYGIPSWMLIAGNMEEANASLALLLEATIQALQEITPEERIVVTVSW